MTVSATTVKQLYNANGVTTTFAIPFEYLSNTSYVEVYLRDASTTPATETLQTYTTHYTIVGSNVVFVSAPANGLKVLIRRVLPLTQLLDYINNGAFLGETHETGLDRLVMITQQIKETVDRSIKMATTSSHASGFNFPEPSASKAIIWNAGADGLENGPTTSEISNAQTYATNASTSATAAATSATNATTSATASAASAASAAAQLASAFYRDVEYKTSADSPITITSADNGKLFVFDSSGGAISVTLPQISAITPPFNLAFLLKTAGNTVTINRAGTDTIMGATSKAISAAGVGFQLVADTGAAPDDWSAMDFGAAADLSVTTGKLAPDAVTFAKMQDIATASLIGRSTAGTGDPENLTVGGHLAISGGVLLPAVGAVVQVAHTEVVTSGTGSTDMVFDDTIPQNTEGDEVLTCAITPKYSTSKLLVRAKGFFAEDSNVSSSGFIAALYRDTTANAIAAEAVSFPTNDQMGASLEMYPCVLEVWVDASSTSATTFKLRAGLFGGGAGAALRWNGINGSRRLGGAMITSITVMEIKQ